MIHTILSFLSAVKMKPVKMSNPKECYSYAQLPDLQTALPGRVRLNLGCGHDYREGYINIDANPSHRADIVADVTWLKPLEDQIAVEAVAQDILEHIPREQCQTALREWNRVLAVGGMLILRVPSLIDLLQRFHRVDLQTPDSQEILIQNLFGTQHYRGDFHLNGFTEQTLKSRLEKAGFTLVELKVADGWLFEGKAIKCRHCPPDPMLRVVGDGDFIEQAYMMLLRRPADLEGVKYYMQLLQEAGIPRESVLESLRNSDEFAKLAKDCLVLET